MRSTLEIAGSKSQQFAISEIDKVFNFYKPKPPLSKFVDNFWLYELDESRYEIERILPTGTLELAINLRKNELRFYGTGGGRAGAIVALVLALIGTSLGGLALSRSRHARTTG